MEVIIPIGYSFFLKSKYSEPSLQRLLTLKRKEILYNGTRRKICFFTVIDRRVASGQKIGV